MIIFQNWIMSPTAWLVSENHFTKCRDVLSSSREFKIVTNQESVSVPRDSLLLFSPFLLSILKDIGVQDDVTTFIIPDCQSVQIFTNIPSNRTSIKQELLDLSEILQVDLYNQNLDFYPIKEERNQVSALEQRSSTQSPSRIL